MHGSMHVGRKWVWWLEREGMVDERRNGLVRGW